MDALQKIVDASRNIVFFGGAGVSTESGVPDFRSIDGLYHQKWKYPPEEILSRSFFLRDPAAFYEFYRLKLLIPNVQPNPAHYKLAELERSGRLRAVVTQNIDGLHQAAGSVRVFELHGSVHRNYCMSCGKFYGLDEIASGKGVPRCVCGGIIKPDVVLYEEQLRSDTLSGAVAAISHADTLIIGGTSLTVYPAASLVQYFKGDSLVLINRDATAMDSAATLLIRGSIGETLDKLRV